MASLFLILLFISLAGMIAGAIRPGLFVFLLKGKATRKNLLLAFGLLAVVFFTVFELLPGRGATEIAVTTAAPTSSEELIQGVVFQGALTEALLKYAEARVHTENLFQNAQDLSKTERTALLNQTLKQWKEAQTAVGQFSAVADWLPDYDYTATVSSGNDDKGRAFALVQKVFAASVDDTLQKLDEAIKKLDEEEQRLKNQQQAWQREKALGGREKVLEIYDKAPRGKRVQAVADALGVDVRTAQEELEKMRNLESKINVKQAEIYNNYSNAAEIVKTGAKIELFIGGLVPAAGGSALAFVGKTGAEAAVGLANSVFTSIAGAGLIMDVSETAIKVGIADESGGIAAVAKAKEAQFFKEMSYVTAIMDPLKAIGQAQKVLEKAGGLTNLLSGDGLKKVADNKDFVKDMITDAPGNLQTIVDSGPAAWDFLNKNLEKTNTLIFGNGKEPGKLALIGSAGEVKAKEPPEKKAFSDFAQKTYAEARKTITEALAGVKVPTFEDVRKIEETRDALQETKKRLAGIKESYDQVSQSTDKEYKARLLPELDEMTRREESNYEYHLNQLEIYKQKAEEWKKQNAEFVMKRNLELAEARVREWREEEERRKKEERALQKMIEQSKKFLAEQAEKARRWAKFEKAEKERLEKKGIKTFDVSTEEGRKAYERSLQKQRERAAEERLTEMAKKKPEFRNVEIQGKSWRHIVSTGGKFVFSDKDLTGNWTISGTLGDNVGDVYDGAKLFKTTEIEINTGSGWRKIELQKGVSTFSYSSFKPAPAGEQTISIRLVNISPGGAVYAYSDSSAWPPIKLVYQKETVQETSKSTQRPALPSGSFVTPNEYEVQKGILFTQSGPQLVNMLVDGQTMDFYWNDDGMVVESGPGGILELGAKRLNDIISVSTSGYKKYPDYISPQIGNSYVIKTHDSKYTIIEVTDIIPGQQLKFNWKYQPDGSTSF